MSLRLLIDLLQPSVWWLIFMPLLFVPLVYLLRRSGLGGWLALLVCLGAAYLAWILPQDEALQILGRPARYDALTAYTVILLFVTTAGLFLLSLQVPQGWSFYPFGIVILILFTLALVNRHLGITALLVEIVVMLSVFIIQGGRLGSVRASLRFLVMMTLAVPLFLLAAWQLEFYRTNFDNAQFLSQLALLIAGGFSLWLGVAPLHGWLSGIAAEAKPGISAFIFIAFPMVAIVVLLHLLASSPWIRDIPQAMDVVLIAGLFTAVVGGLFASVQRAFGPLMGYAALFDLGTSLVALGLDSDRGQTVILFALFVRAIALVLVAVAGASIEYQGINDAFEQVRGLGRRLPVPTIGLIIGGLTLAGAPFTAGFVSHWMLLQALSAIDGRWPFLILLGSLGVAVGYIRGLRALLDTPTTSSPHVQQWSLSVLVSVLVILCISLGLFPQVVLDTVQFLIQAI